MTSPVGYRIAIVAYENLEALDVTGPWEVFHTAGAIAGSPPELICATASGEDVAARAASATPPTRRSRTLTESTR